MRHETNFKSRPQTHPLRNFAPRVPDSRKTGGPLGFPPDTPVGRAPPSTAAQPTLPKFGMIYRVAGAPVTIKASLPADHESIRDVLKAAKERAERGQAKIGSSALAKAFD